MEGRKTAAVIGLAALVSLAGCERSPLVPGPSTFVAEVEGSVVASYEGSGHFSYGSARRPASPLGFVLHSAGIGAAAGQGFELYRTSREALEPGSYALGSESGAVVPFHAVYTRREGNVVERFAAREGELRIEEASAGRVTGAFRFTAVLSSVCTVQGSAYSCTTRAADPEAPVVEVSGAFQAVPSRR